MRLNNEVSNELKSYLSEHKIINKEFYYDVFSVLKKYFDFLVNTNIEFSNEKYFGMYFDIIHNKLIINIELFKQYLNQRIKMDNSVFNVSNEEIIFINTVISILHEITHAEQRAYAYEYYSKYNEINRMYYNIFESSNILYKINYKFFSNDFSIERNANICGYREGIKILDAKYHHVLIDFYLYCLTNNYYLKSKNKLVTPVRKTYSLCALKYDIMSKNIPTNIRILHGLDINNQEYKKYIESITFDYTDEEYEEIKQLIRK